MTGRAAVALCASIGLLATAPAASPRVARMPEPSTLAVVAGQVGALAQSPNRLAFLGGDLAVCPQAQILDLRTHHRVRVSSRPSNRETLHCAPNLGSFGVLAFDGNRVLWQMYYGSNLSFHVMVFSAALNDRRSRELGGGSYDNDSDFGGALPMAGAPGRLVFFQYDECSDEDCVYPNGVRVVVGRRSRKLFASEGVAGVALAGRRLAVLESPKVSRHSAPAWSPDGKQIAWVQDGAGVEVGNADGSGRRLVAKDGGAPSWAPDGSRLAFSAVTSNGPVIEVVNADGSGRRTLAAGSSPEWSPTGEQIAFVRGNPADVFRINADGSRETRLTTEAVPRTFRPHWSPDGTKLLVERADSAYIVDAVTGGETVLGPYTSPAWSPDGTKIAFTHPGTSEPPYIGYGSLAVTNSNGTNVRVLTNELGVDFADVDPVWSSDGTKIAFEHRDTNTLRGDVLVINSGGTGGRKLGAGGAPAWAPGTATVAWGDGSKSGNGLMVANEDGSGRRQIASDVYHSPIVIRTARTGKVVKRFDTRGTAVSVAMSASYCAVVLQTGRSKYQLRRYRPDGRFLGAANLPKGVSSVLAGARAFVYVASGKIFAVDAPTGRSRVVAKPVAFSGRLSILNRRLVWTESAGRNRTRIRAIDLPR